MKRAVIIAVVFVLTVSFLLSGPLLTGQTAPTTAPADDTEKKASVSPEAQKELDALSNAYKNLKSLELTGTLRAEFDVAGEQVNREANFTSSYQSPNKFRHEMSDDILVGSTGEKIFAFKPADRLYILKDALQDDSEEIAQPIPDLLKLQNPSLLLAMSNDPAARLQSGANSIEKLADESIDGNVHRVLQVNSDTGNVRVLVDPKTNLIRRMVMDVSPMLVARGQEDVKKAQMTLDYGRINLNAALPAEQFSWSPPENARDASQSMAAIGGGSAEALKGKPAPDFTLPDLNDKPVKLSELRGSVVVLDFWASWCGPCVASMPTLAELHKEFSPQGVKVFAVNIGEDKDLVRGFLTSRNLDLPVLLDQERQTAENYGIEGIPTTLVIDASGKVHNVHVGMPPDGAAQLRRDIEAAMKHH